MTVFFYCFREREKVLSIYDHGVRRAHDGVATSASAAWPWTSPTGLLDRCQKFVDEMPAHIDEYETLLTKNPIWLARTQGVAPLLGDGRGGAGRHRARRCAARA